MNKVELERQGYTMSYTFTPGTGSAKLVMGIIGEQLEREDFDVEIVRITDVRSAEGLNPSVLDRRLVYTRPKCA